MDEFETVIELRHLFLKYEDDDSYFAKDFLKDIRETLSKQTEGL